MNPSLVITAVEKLNQHAFETHNGLCRPGGDFVSPFSIWSDGDTHVIQFCQEPLWDTEEGRHADTVEDLVKHTLDELIPRSEFLTQLCKDLREGAPKVDSVVEAWVPVPATLTVPFESIFRDPDDVGSSEYRAIHDYIAESLNILNGTDLLFDDSAAQTLRMLESFKSHSESLINALRSKTQNHASI